MARAAQSERTTSARKSAAVDAPELRAIPLDLAPLVAPHKKHGKLSLRVERLPQGARLSKGSRNNDGSWSLTRDELDELEYLLPEGLDDKHALAVRIISLVAGNTLAVVEVPVSGHAAEPSVVLARGVPTANEDLRVLREELAQLKAAVSARDGELNTTRQDSERAKLESSAQAVEAQLAAARAAWQSELDQRLTAAANEAAAALKKERDAWEAAEKSRAGEHDAQLKQEIGKVREVWQREAQDALAKAEASWKADETARAAAAEAKWQEKSTKLAADAQAKGDASRDLAAAREKLSALEKSLAERDGALAKAAAAGAEAQQRSQREMQEALAKAEQAWKTAEAARFAAAEAQWREKLAAAVPAAPPAGAQKAEEELRKQLGALQATLAERDASLAGATKAAEEARQAALREAQEALAKAEEKWKAGEAARLAAAEADWRAKAAPAPALAAPAPPVNMAREQKRDQDLFSLREQLATAQAALTERDGALVRASKAIEEAQASRERAVQEAVAKIEKEWKAKPSEKPPAGGDARALADVKAKLETAEEALALARVRAKDEIATLKQSLAKRDEEISRARSAHNEPRGYEPPAVVQPSRIREMINRPDERGALEKRTFMREIIVAVVLGVAGVFFYPDIEALIFGEPPSVRVVPLPRPKPELPAPVAVERTATLARDAKLRAEASPTSAVSATLARGASVVIVEEREKWMLVRFAEGAATKQGWVKSSFLSDVTPAPAPAP